MHAEYMQEETYGTQITLNKSTIPNVGLDKVLQLRKYITDTLNVVEEC